MQLVGGKGIHEHYLWGCDLKRSKQTCSEVYFQLHLDIEGVSFLQTSDVVLNEAGLVYALLSS